MDSDGLEPHAIDFRNGKTVPVLNDGFDDERLRGVEEVQGLLSQLPRDLGDGGILGLHESRSEWRLVCEDKAVDSVA